MTEDDAKAWVSDRYGVAAVDRLQILVDAVIAESRHQNLIAASTLDTIWARHIVDSAQLLWLAGAVSSDDRWVDIGSGAGFPGLVIAALCSATVVLIEPRKRRAEFLDQTVSILGVGARTQVVCGRAEQYTGHATVISARAVAQLCDIFSWASGSTDLQTRWFLPKGRSALEEVASAKKIWHGTFHVEHSITDPASLIVLASGVKRR